MKLDVDIPFALCEDDSLTPQSLGFLFIKMATNDDVSSIFFFFLSSLFLCSSTFPWCGPATGVSNLSLSSHNNLSAWRLGELSAPDMSLGIHEELFPLAEIHFYRVDNDGLDANQLIIRCGKHMDSYDG